MHELFSGSGEPRYQCALTPSPVGSAITFTPTHYFGYYYSDVSDPTEICDANGNCVDSNHGGCYAYTLFNLNEPRCTAAGQNGGQGFFYTNGDHDFVVFSTNPGSGRATYWIAGEDPTDCTTQDTDCNLTLVKVSRVP